MKKVDKKRRKWRNALEIKEEADVGGGDNSGMREDEGKVEGRREKKKGEEVGLKIKGKG